MADNRTFALRIGNEGGDITIEVNLKIKDAAPVYLGPDPLVIEWDGFNFAPVDLNQYFRGRNMVFTATDLGEGFALSEAGILTGPQEAQAA